MIATCSPAITLDHTIVEVGVSFRDTSFPVSADLVTRFFPTKLNLHDWVSTIGFLRSTLFPRGAP